MSGTVSFKVYLESPFMKEIRRFGIDSDVVTNFVYLREKLRCIFPGLRGEIFTIAWKDAAGDSITISSDEELEIALDEANPDMPRLYKLYITLGPDNYKETLDTKDEGALHVNVTCDGCDNEIRGSRYKCAQCEDYDLCSKCESLGLHPEHYMIRIPVPQLSGFLFDFPSCVGRLLKEFLPKPVPNKFPLRRRCHRQSTFHHDGGLFTKAFENCLHKKDTPRGVPTSCMAESTEQNKETHEFCGTESSNEKSQQKYENFLQECVLPMATPSAFDVQIKLIEKPSTSQSDTVPSKTECQSTSCVDENTTKKFPGEGKKLIDKEKDDKASVSDTMSTISQDASVTKGTSTDEWTIVEKYETNNISRTSSASSVLNDVAKQTAPIIPSAPIAPSAPSTSAGESRQDQTIYPKLPKQEEKVYHSNPKIQKAIDAMISMGFSNNGGLLTYILEREDGDIGKVLDTYDLPVNKQ